jgi:hypothetical protein
LELDPRFRLAGRAVVKGSAALYLRVLPISVNTVLTFAPTVWTAVMMKTAISEAMSAYSIAVTPDLSATNLFMDRTIRLLPHKDRLAKNRVFQPLTGPKMASPDFDPVNLNSLSGSRPSKLRGLVKR